MSRINLKDESSTHRRRAGEGIRNSGWMVFDLEQRRKQQGFRAEDSVEEYPALSGAYPEKGLHNRHILQLEKPYSSVVGVPVNSASLVDCVDRNRLKTLPVTNSSRDTTWNTDASRTLIDLHPWADEGLIRDVLAAANEDVDEASCFLETMHIGKGALHVSHKTPESRALAMSTLDSATSSTVEPEMVREEEDVYLVHRKDALKMIRSASRLSKSSNEAYLRGDHVSARHFSLRAQDQWKAAKNLNVKAANAILSTRNSLNDVWRLDLHGLHSAEAIVALQQRLQAVETLLSQKHMATESRILPPPLEQSPDPLIMKSLSRQDLTSKGRSRLLQVITGKGNHSQGPASLPSSVKSFLSENGYYFEEIPGVIVIRPKFQQR